MTSFETTVSKIKGALDHNAPIKEFNSLMLSDMAMSLALIADRLEGEESATSPRDEKKDPEGGTQEWRVIDKEAPVPVSWIEAGIKRLENTNQAASKIEANSIRTMLERWRRQEEAKHNESTES